MGLKVSLNTGINRIRLEFKVDQVTVVTHPSEVLIESDWNLKEFVVRLGSCGRNGINRIRLEFKAVPHFVIYGVHAVVLIESDWNLKMVHLGMRLPENLVLIESDWNLKRTTTCDYCGSELVLIESDWNLKKQNWTQAS